MKKWAFGFSRREVIKIAAEYAKRNKIETRFNDDQQWLIDFKPHISQVCEICEKKGFVVYGYCELLKKTLEWLELQNKPFQIWNLDPSKTKVLGKVGKPFSSSSGREDVTFTKLANAAGVKRSPFIVFNGLNVWDQWQTSNDIFPDMTYAASNNGWMT